MIYLSFCLGFFFLFFKQFIYKSSTARWLYYTCPEWWESILEMLTNLKRARSHTGRVTGTAIRPPQLQSKIWPWNVLRLNWFLKFDLLLLLMPLAESFSIFPPLLCLEGKTLFKIWHVMLKTSGAQALKKWFYQQPSR